MQKVILDRLNTKKYYYKVTVTLTAETERVIPGMSEISKTSGRLKSEP